MASFFQSHDVGEPPEALMPASSSGARQPPRPSFGLKWRQVGNEPPGRGRELMNAHLREGLLNRFQLSKPLVFSQAEWDSFGIADLSVDDYIEVDGVFLQPAVHGSRRRQWVPMSAITPDATRWSASSMWTPTAPLRSWTGGLEDGAYLKVMSPRSVESVIARLRKPHRAPPRPPAIRLHTAAPLRRSESQPPGAVRVKAHRPVPTLLPAGRSSAPSLASAPGRRSAPNLGGTPAPAWRASPSIQRRLPDGATNKLVTRHMQRALVATARAERRELVVIIEARPVTTQTLHQREVRPRFRPAAPNSEA